jgi:spore maturation protein CgeB
MRILFVTESWPRDKGPFETLYCHYQRYLAGLGHEVEVVDNKVMRLPFGGQTVWNCPRPLRALGWPRWNDWLVNVLLRRRAAQWQPDMILFFKAENIRWRTTAWLRRHTDALLCNWDLDNPFWPSNTSLDLLRSIPLYDCFGSLAEHFIAPLHSLGCPRAEYMPMFFIPDRFQVEQPLTDADRQRFASDLLFIGRATPERADMLRPLAGWDLAVYGPDWERVLASDDPLRRRVRGGFLDGVDYAKALRCCRIAINVLVTQCKGANNLRTFEATGCGAFLLTEYSREQAETLFRADEEIVCYRNPEELATIAQRYLPDEATRARIAAAGQRRCLAEHTLGHRLDRWLAIAAELRKERQR